VEKIYSVDSIVEVQCYVLPHKDFLAPNLELSAAGPHGWTAQQASTSIEISDYFWRAVGLGLDRGVHGRKRRLTGLLDFDSISLIQPTPIGKLTFVNPAPRRLLDFATH
jgi:hypothetical protein